MDLAEKYKNDLIEQNNLFKNFMKNKPMCLSDVFNLSYDCKDECKKCKYNLAVRYNNFVNPIDIFIKDCFKNQACPLIFFDGIYEEYEDNKCSKCSTKERILKLLLEDKKGENENAI